MIIGAHVMLHSRDEAADRAFLSDVLKFGSVDAGDGFMIYGIPPAEMAVHRSDRNDLHQLYLIIAPAQVPMAAEPLPSTATQSLAEAQETSLGLRPPIGAGRDH